MSYWLLQHIVCLCICVCVCVCVCVCSNSNPPTAWIGSVDDAPLNAALASAPSRGNLHFHFAGGFATQRLAGVLHSLVRVSRRDGWSHVLPTARYTITCSGIILLKSIEHILYAHIHIHINEEASPMYLVCTCTYIHIHIHMHTSVHCNMGHVCTCICVCVCVGVCTYVHLL